MFAALYAFLALAGGGFLLVLSAAALHAPLARVVALAALGASLILFALLLGLAALIGARPSRSAPTRGVADVPRAAP